MKFFAFTNLDENKYKEHGYEKRFSRNIVVLQITDAEVDVTFLDLPGIISSIEKITSSVREMGREY